MVNDCFVQAGRKGRTRTEYDSLGEMQVPHDAYWGIQTERALMNFCISGETMAEFPSLITALAQVKKAAAKANAACGALDSRKVAAITKACDEVIAGMLGDQFPIDPVQGGAGTSSNMNINEVVANRGLELMGYGKGQYEMLHPNDHVNMSQSTNDVYPTAVKISIAYEIKRLISEMEMLGESFARKGGEFGDVLTVGRTQLQDAVPMTLGQSFGAYQATVDDCVTILTKAVDSLCEINMGATAIGTCINTPRGYVEEVNRQLAAESRLPLRTSKNLFKGTSDAAPFALVAGDINAVACALTKISNDIRLLSSGPRAGLGEIRLPPMQPGSSIMPGKVNPVIPEALNLVCFQAMGALTVVSNASSAGQLQLNAFEPIIAYNMLKVVAMMRLAVHAFREKCVDGIEADRQRCASLFEESIGIATALSPLIGYEKAAKIAKNAQASGKNVRDVALEQGISEDELSSLLCPDKIATPHA